MRLAPDRYSLQELRTATWKQELTFLRLALAPVEVSEEESGGESIPFQNSKKNAPNEVIEGTDTDNSADKSDEEGEDV